MKRVLIIGGYGNFGTFIAQQLALEERLQLIIAGRSLEKARRLAESVPAENRPEFTQLDIHQNLVESLEKARPDIIIHTSGPFQSQGYEVAEAAIQCGAHYIDLSDGREFVANITVLDKLAKQADVSVISGASSVPTLTSALVDHYQSEFAQLDSLSYGITTAQKTTRGLATTAAILGYVGKSFKTLVDGAESDIFGWQGICIRKYRELGLRMLGYCNIPDLAIFPKRYPQLRSIHFYAGIEIPFIHTALWLLSWLVRFKLIKNLDRAAPWLLKLSSLFDCLGSDNSGFHMVLSGRDHDGLEKSITFELIARSGDGPYIPCMPSILLCKKLANGEIADAGARPCVGIINKDEYLDALSHLDIDWTTA